jgi:hypothetical protein
MSQLVTHDSLLGQLPNDVQEQVKDILARILKLAGYNSNSNTDSNSVGGTTKTLISYPLTTQELKYYVHSVIPMTDRIIIGIISRAK